MLQRKVKIYVTDLPAFLYCQMQYYLIKQGVKTEDQSIKTKMSDGKKVHSSLYNKHYHKTTSYDSFNDAVLKTIADGKTRSIRELRVTKETGDYILIGRIDEIRIEKDRIILIDDKDIDELTPFMKTMYQQQLEIYAELFVEQFFPFLEVFIVLRRARTKELFFNGQFFNITSFDFETIITLIIEYWNGELILQKTKNKEKCKFCRLLYYCQKNVSY